MLILSFEIFCVLKGFEMCSIAAVALNICHHGFLFERSYEIVNKPKLQERELALIHKSTATHT